MRFHADPMFPGDLHDAAARFALDIAGRRDQPAARAEAWRDARGMGWPALLIDEAHGGAGGTLNDLGSVIEACARHATGLPLTRRCALAPALLMAAGGEAAQQALHALAAGEIDIDVADGDALVCRPQGRDGLRVDGTLEQMDLTLPSTHCLVVAADRMLLLPSEALPAPASRHVGIDGARQADLQIDALHLPSATVLQSGPQVLAAAAAGADVAALVTAIEMAATLGAIVEQSIEYLSARVQFGVALATFQVLRHQVVDLYVQYESASVLLSRLVADVVAGGRLEARDASLCKLYLNDLARRGAEAAIQLHGAMGMTAELATSRLIRRLLCAEFEHGDRMHQLTRLQRIDAVAA